LILLFCPFLPSFITITTSNKRGKMPKLERDIDRHIVVMAKSNTQINRNNIFAYAREVARDKYNMHELPLKDQLVFSHGWLSRKMKRLPVKSRPIHGEAGSVEIDSEKLKQQIKKIEELLEPYNPVDIMNFEETGLYYKSPPKRTIAKNPMAGLKRSKERITVGFLCNSDASYMGYPIVIRKSANPNLSKKKLKVHYIYNILLMLFLMHCS
jgi:hypothetical protein